MQFRISELRGYQNPANNSLKQIRRYGAIAAQNPASTFLLQSTFFVLHFTLTCSVRTSAGHMTTESKYSPGTELLGSRILP